jgi:hypothetical protein
MVLVTAAELDANIAAGDRWLWPYYFDKQKRVWPPPPENSELTFYQLPDLA